QQQCNPNVDQRCGDRYQVAFHLTPSALSQFPEGKFKLQPLEFEQVRRTAQEPLFNSLMEEHHYLGYEQPVGEHLNYLVWAEGRPIAAWPGHRLRATSAAVI